jgi:hypothetical protein
MGKTPFLVAVFADIEVYALLAYSVAVGVALPAAVAAEGRRLLLVGEGLFFNHILAPILQL